MKTLPLLLACALAAPAAAQCSDALSLARNQLSATGAGGYALFAGGTQGMSGLTLVDVYDVAANTWSVTELSAPRGGIGAASVGNVAVFAGGGFFTAFGSYATLDVVDIFDVSAGTRTTAQLSVRRMFPAAAAAGTKIVVAGGIHAGAPPFSMHDTVDIYDTATGTWTAAQLSQARYLMAAAGAGDFALFAGGHDGALPVATVDVYHAPSGTWVTSALSLPRMQATAAALGSRIYVAGGLVWTGTDFVATDVVDVYDTATGTWSVTALSTPRRLAAATSVGGKLYVAGGDGPGGPSDVVDVFDGATWSTLRLSEAREAVVGCSTQGTALFAGGLTAGDALTPTVDRFSAGGPSSFCFGDGSGAQCACGNAGAIGEGCANSSGRGARLDGAGCNAVSADSLRLDIGGLPAAQPVLLFAGQNATVGGAGAVFGDGLRCAGGAVHRLGVHAGNAAGTSSWGPGLIAAQGWGAGDTRRFQAWYRDPAGPCGTGYNLSNGVEVTFVP
ncbi:MAG: hypothetical protein H6828_03215 [Planctomycetes bacterium]|nr:hypothetical protein [Planctomycetota bacterium]